MNSSAGNTLFIDLAPPNKWSHAIISPDNRTDTGQVELRAPTVAIEGKKINILHNLKENQDLLEDQFILVSDRMLDDLGPGTIDKHQEAESLDVARTSAWPNAFGHQSTTLMTSSPVLSEKEADKE